MPFLADTNILLRLAEPSDPEYAIVRGAVEALVAQDEEPCYAAQNLVEFWNVWHSTDCQERFRLVERRNR